MLHETDLKKNLFNAFQTYYDTKREHTRPRVEYGFDNLQLFVCCASYRTRTLFVLCSCHT